MKKLIILLPIFVLLQMCLYAQVGIGTTSPSTKLTIAQNSVLKTFSLGSSATGSYVEKMYIDSLGGVTSVTDASTGVMQTYNGSVWKNNW